MEHTGVLEAVAQVYSLTCLQLGTPLAGPPARPCESTRRGLNERARTRWTRQAGCWSCCRTRRSRMPPLRC